MDYVLEEVRRCQASITHGYRHPDDKPAGLLATWFCRYVETAKSLMTTETAASWSQAATAVLPAINPYAEKYYDTYKDFKDCVALTQAYEQAALKLGRLILKFKPDATLADGKGTNMQKDWEGLLRTSRTFG